MRWVAVAAKDLREEARGRETLVPVLLVALLVVGVGLVAFHDVEEHAAVAAGTVWLALAFGTSVGLARAFGAEKDRGTLAQLLLLPIERGHVYLGKAAASFVLLVVVASVVAPGFLVASGHAAPLVGGLALFLILGAAGFAVTGTTMSALVANTRARDVLLPVLLLPLLVPLLLAGIHGTMDVLSGAPFEAWRSELLVLLGYDVAFAAASWLLFEQAVSP